MRGAKEFVELAKCFSNDTSVIFSSFGFGRDSDIKTVFKGTEKFIKLKLFSERHEMLKAIMSSDICFNYVSSEQFQNSSFPSKLIEYYCLGNMIISNFNEDLVKKKLITFKSLKEAKSKIEHYLNRKKTKRLSFQSRKNAMDQFSITASANLLRSLNLKL